MKRRLATLYGRENAENLADRLYMLMGRYGLEPRDNYEHGEQAVGWSEKDVVLITYADIVSKQGEAPLQTLKSFCDRRLRDAINGVHLLPFSPASSDGGFSVIDYREVDEEVGTWHEVKLIARDYKLMADLVLNHCSQKSEWFQKYLRGIAPYQNYFIEEIPGQAWLDQVTRPRPWPLLTSVETARGEKHVWTTFSADQVDVNWKSPDVLFEFLDIFIGYIDRGARIIRLDAVAFLWKEENTTCIHHEKTHEVVKLLRDVLSTIAPHVILLTETNVPHQENISYFGNGDEAQMVYQFALPPLLLHALLRGETKYLVDWAETLGALPAGCTYFNFTASHDGVGVRALSGLVPEGELEWMIERVSERGGLVSYRKMPDGSESPYEMNITYRSALECPSDSELGARRFICSQAVMLALAGIPGVYFHSIIGSKNWEEGPKRADGEKRDINRQRLDFRDLEELLDDVSGESAWIANVYATMLRARRGCRAFHPDGVQSFPKMQGGLLAIRRVSPDGNETVLCLFNFTDQNMNIEPSLVADALGVVPSGELLRKRSCLADFEWKLGAYECMWLK